MSGSTRNLQKEQHLSFPRKEFESQTSLMSRRTSMLSNCRICLSTILDPASLTCGHRFCEKCLNQYWRVGDRQQFIVCPLCRANAFKVDFAKKEDVSSTEDFRKTFNPMEKLNCVNRSDMNHNHVTIMCLKISILMPIFYYMLKWLRLPLVQLLTLFNCKATYGM